MMKTILIADDNAASRELLREVLESLGLNVVEARDGQEALAGIQEAWPALAFLDIQMPVLDGFAVVEAVRALKPARPIYLIALTALAMETDRQRILAAGFDAHVSKPISISGLRKLVSQLLSSEDQATSAKA